MLCSNLDSKPNKPPQFVLIGLHQRGTALQKAGRPCRPRWCPKHGDSCPAGAVDQHSVKIIRASGWQVPLSVTTSLWHSSSSYTSRNRDRVCIHWDARFQQFCTAAGIVDDIDAGTACPANGGNRGQSCSHPKDFHPGARMPAQKAGRTDGLAQRCRYTRATFRPLPPAVARQDLTRITVPGRSSPSRYSCPTARSM